MLDYLSSHWVGRQNLWRSCWINLVVVGFIVLVAVRRILPRAIEYWPLLTWYLVGAVVSVALLIAVWQILGVVRACQLQLRDTAAAGDSVLVYALIIGYSLVLFVSFFDLSRYSLPTISEITVGTKTRVVHPYLDSQHSMLIEGMIDFGLTALLEEKLQGGVGIRRIVLNSQGGVISEARGVVRLIREYALSTHVKAECFSACTLIFISGERRSIAPEGRLGFHQYALDSISHNPGVNPARQQQQDAKFFAGQGVNDAFIERAYQEPNASLWIPTLQELQDSGVITNIEP